MKIETVYINKGGSGKSSVVYNMAKKKSLSGSKVLLIDGDRSCNLTYSFGGLGESSIVDIFKKQPVEIYSVDENIDIIKGSTEFNDDSLDIKSRQNNCLILYAWIKRNWKELDEKYDYIIIDTHNDTSLITYNCIAVADMVLAVADPTKNSLRAWVELLDTLNYLKSEVIEIDSGESYVNAAPYLLANQIDVKGNNLTRRSKEFLEWIENEDDYKDKYIGMITRREMFGKSLTDDQSIYDQLNMMDEKEAIKHKEFIKAVDLVFDKVYDILDNL